MNQTDIRQAAANAATTAATTTKSFLSDQVGKRSTDIGLMVCSTANDLRQAGEQLRAKGGGSGAALLTDRAAQYVDRFGSYLQDADADRLVADVEAFSRKRPYAVAASALVLGFAASRLLKASSARRYYREYAPYAGSTAEIPATNG